MTKGIFIIIVFGAILSCTSKQKDHEEIKKESVDHLLNSLRRNIENYNNSHPDDSISTEIVILDKRIMHKSDYEFLILETITNDQRRYQAIIGLNDSGDSGFVDFTLSNEVESKFTIENIKDINDSLIFHLRLEALKERNDYQLSYDKNFNGKSFPWTIEEM